jgi:prepilin-type N-terminal cleavage/methylation domain-containing protein/prepilin-type processing-associated H-X9-DG protein
MIYANLPTRSNTTLYSSRPLSGFTLVELLVVIAIIGVLAGFLIPAVRASRASSKNAACKNNLRQLGIALDLHHDNHGSYPVDGENGFGIGAFLLPYLEQAPLYERLNPRQKLGASPKNPELINTTLEVFMCPSLGKKPRSGSGPGGQSNYIGNSNLFSKLTIYDDIRDGESNTIAMGETTSGHSWAMPRLAAAAPPSEEGTYGSRHGGGANFVFCDASVHFISEEIDPVVFTALCTIDGKEVIADWQ